MSKSVLVIDCIYGYRQSKPDWCPLKPFPERKNFVNSTNGIEANANVYSAGWNGCIDAITGEVE